MLIEGTVASVPPQGGRKHDWQEFMQEAWHNILYMSCDTIAGLEKVIRDRSEKSGLGFNASVRIKDDGKRVGDSLMQVDPEDLVRIGLIPEFVGRLPVIATLSELDEEALIQILTEPKNSLTKQYGRLFEMEGVELEFRTDALKAIAQRALKRKIGARGLRSILENVLLDTMYEIPSIENVSKVVIDENVISGNAKPLLIYESAEQPPKAMPED